MLVPNLHVAEVMFLGGCGDIMCDGEHDRKEDERGRMGDGVLPSHLFFFQVLTILHSFKAFSLTMWNRTASSCRNEAV